MFILILTEYNNAFLPITFCPILPVHSVQTLCHATVVFLVSVYKCLRLFTYLLT